MSLASVLLTVLGLSVFEIINSIDNAIINAEVLSSMEPKARKWFLGYGLILAVLLVRGILPWLIIWITSPSLGPLGALTASFNSKPQILEQIHKSSPLLLSGGGLFLLLLFFHWLILEPKKYGLVPEKFTRSQIFKFYITISLLLLLIAALAFFKNPQLAAGSLIGTFIFFITLAFKKMAEKSEEKLINKPSSSGKIVYLEVIDACFSIDGVLGAFAFTLAVPLILIGNGLGALVVRTLTAKNIETVKKYGFLKNGAMYSIFFLGTVMVLESFGADIPNYLPPTITFLVVGYFLYRGLPKLCSLE